jgi:hypothetical protein
MAREDLEGFFQMLNRVPEHESGAMYEIGGGGRPPSAPSQEAPEKKGKNPLAWMQNDKVAERVFRRLMKKALTVENTERLTPGEGHIPYSEFPTDVKERVGAMFGNVLGFDPKRKYTLRERQMLDLMRLRGAQERQQQKAEEYVRSGGQIR